MYSTVPQQSIAFVQGDMGVDNTTGAASTLFISLRKVLTSAAYTVYCRSVGNQGNDRERNNRDLIRPGGWYAVDVSMVLSAMLRGRGATMVMRLQQCTPPMPTKKEVYSYMDTWYKAHDLFKCTIVLTLDGRRCPFKKRNAENARLREQARRARDTATTFAELERCLRKLVRVDGDILFWLRQWIKDRKYGEKVYLFGAPFEADAQMTQLERQGIVDGIITDDADVWFLGATNILKGFTTRKRGPYSAILGGMVSRIIYFT